MISSEAEFRMFTAGQSAFGVARAVVSLSTGDYVELFVCNKTSTTAVRVEYMNFTVA